MGVSLICQGYLVTPSYPSVLPHTLLCMFNNSREVIPCPQELIVQTRAARGAVPVAGAQITVFCADNDQTPCASVRTDSSGSTAPIALEAPALTEHDAETAPPFASYRVSIDHPDYRPVTVLDVAIFADLTTVLPVAMIPPRSIEELRKSIIIDSTEKGPSGSGRE